jgi:hypothetical protein
MPNYLPKNPSPLRNEVLTHEEEEERERIELAAWIDAFLGGQVEAPAAEQPMEVDQSQTVGMTEFEVALWHQLHGVVQGEGSGSETASGHMEVDIAVVEAQESSVASDIVMAEEFVDSLIAGLDAGDRMDVDHEGTIPDHLEEQPLELPEPLFDPDRPQQQPLELQPRNIVNLNPVRHRPNDELLRPTLERNVNRAIVMFQLEQMYSSEWTGNVEAQGQVSEILIP